MGLAEILSRKMMRIFNLGAIVLTIIAWVVRFYYFSKREKIVEIEKEFPNENGLGTHKGTILQKEVVQDGFWLIVYTIIIFPMLIFIFVIQEFQVKHVKLAPISHHFYFLDYYVGKGVYLLLLGTLLLQHSEVLEWIIVVAILMVVIVDFLHPCLFGAGPINGDSLTVL